MAYASWSVVAGEQPSASKWTILGTNDSSFNDGSGFAAGALGTSNASLVAGIACQTVSTNFPAVGTGTTIIPYDDTIPQITEGSAFMSQAITPKAATNTLVIEANFNGAYSVADQLQIALFQDSTANALAAVAAYQATANGMVLLILRHTMTAGTTLSTSFSIRAGGSTAGTITFNGAGGTRRFGGVTLSHMRIAEIKV